MITDRELLENIDHKLDYIIQYINSKNNDNEDMKQFMINVIANGFRV